MTFLTLPLPDGGEADDEGGVNDCGSDDDDDDDDEYEDEVAFLTLRPAPARWW